MGYLYVIGFVNGMVKIGCTLKPDKRMRTHMNSMGAVVRVSKIWLSECHANHTYSETTLKKALGLIRTEVLEADVNSVIDMAKNIVSASMSHKQIQPVGQEQEQSDILIRDAISKSLSAQMWSERYSFLPRLCRELASKFGPPTLLDISGGMDQFCEFVRSNPKIRESMNRSAEVLYARQ